MEELHIVNIAALFVFLVLIFQVRGWIKRLRQDQNKIVLQILGGLLLDVFLLFLFVSLQLVHLNYLKNRYRPTEISYARVAPELAEVAWRTREPALSMLIWGIDANHLQNYELGKSGSQKTRDHQVLLDAEPNQPVYFAIVHQGELYGDENGQPYKLGVQSQYQLTPVEPARLEVKEEVREVEVAPIETATDSTTIKTATNSGDKQATESGEIVE